MDNALGNWSEVEIAGHSADVYLPPRIHPHGYAVIYLHGQAGARLHSPAGFLQAFDRHGLRVVCPRTGPSWWTDRIWPGFDAQISAERYVVDSVRGWLQSTWQVEPPAIALLGTSMGGQGALRIAFKHPTKFPIVAAIAPAIDYQLLMNEGDEVLYELYRDPESARQDTALLHIHPLNWPRNTWFCCDPVDYEWRDSADRLRMKMAALGVPFECDLETSAGGHSLAYYNHMAEKAVGYIANRLEAERLRVP